MLRGRSFLTRANIILYILLEEDFWGSVSKKGSFSRYTIGMAKRAMYYPCLAGLAPASHPVKRVGTQRVALDRVNMRLQVKACKDTEDECIGEYAQSEK